MKIIYITVALMFFLPVLAGAGDIDNGKELFKRKCKSCHRLTEGVMVGPSLAGVTKRRTEEWLHKWLKNPRKMIKEGDPIATELAKQFKKKMPVIKAMQSEKNRNDILHFLKSVDGK